MRKFVALIALSLLTAGCVSNGKMFVNRDQLQHHRFVLESVNGKPVTGETTQPELSFGWTRKEAIVKQRGGSAWQIVSIDSTQQSALSVSHCQFGSLILAVCTPTPFALTHNVLQQVESL